MTEEILYVLVPGRHHLLTNFQFEELQRVANHATQHVTDLDGKPIHFSRSVKAVWAVTSANHSNTRRNPLPAGKREAAIARFSVNLGMDSLTFTIDDIGETPRFADYLIKLIEVQSEGMVAITPYNTVVATSTAEVIEKFEKLGYRILPLERKSRESEDFIALRAWDLVTAIAAAGKDWRYDPSYRRLVHPESQRVLENYNLGDLIVRVHQDTLLGTEGDITGTRDYGTYDDSFEANAERKYELFAAYLRAGRVVDLGCAGGSLIKVMQRDPRLQESDFYGIEVTRYLYTKCQQRKENGYFRNENTFFYQRNLASGKVFADNSVDTFTMAALTHEIYSYLGINALRTLLRWLWEQLLPGGVFINVDVVGPENKDDTVLLKLSETDGQAIDPLIPFDVTEREKLAEHVRSLSTHGKFLRFAQDFRHHEGGTFEYEFVEINGQKYAELSLEDAAEFLSKKDYADSWYSEMHERFCFWSFTQWKQELEAAGFEVDPASHAYRNEWIVENRWEGHAALYQVNDDDEVVQIEYPVTNVLLIARKR